MEFLRQLSEVADVAELSCWLLVSALIIVLLCMVFKPRKDDN